MAEAELVASFWRHARLDLSIVVLPVLVVKTH
jgi:hypothetical protein